MDNKPQDQGTADQAALLAYVEQMIKDSGDPSQDTPANKEELLKSINDEINRHLVDLLSQADQEELNSMLDRDVSDDELNNFFSAKIPNIDEEIAATLLDFRTMYLNPISGQDITEPQNVQTESSEPESLDPAPINSDSTDSQN